MAIIVGQKERRWFGLGGDICLVYRPPETSEIVGYQDGIEWKRKGKALTTRSAARRLELANKLIIDCEGFEYYNGDKKLAKLNAKSKAEDIAHLEIEGKKPKSFLELIPAEIKLAFVDDILLGEDEKNL